MSSGWITTWTRAMPGCDAKALSVWASTVAPASGAYCFGTPAAAAARVPRPAATIKAATVLLINSPASAQAASLNGPRPRGNCGLCFSRLRTHPAQNNLPNCEAENFTAQEQGRTLSIHASDRTAAPEDWDAKPS